MSEWRGHKRDGCTCPWWATMMCSSSASEGADDVVKMSRSSPGARYDENSLWYWAMHSGWPFSRDMARSCGSSCLKMFHEFLSSARFQCESAAKFAVENATVRNWLSRLISIFSSISLKEIGFSNICCEDEKKKWVAECHCLKPPFSKVPKTLEETAVRFKKCVDHLVF